MKLPKILIDQKFSASEIEIRNSSSTRKINTEIEGKLKLLWEEKVKEALTNGKKAWDSEVYRLNSFNINVNKVSFDLGIVNYSIVKGIKDFREEILNLGDEYYTKGLFVASLVKTNDKKYIFGELSGNTLNSNSIDLIGGVVSKTEMEVSNGDDLFQFVFTELKEEANIDLNQVIELNLIGAILTDKFQVGLIFKTELNIDSNTLLNNFEKENDNEMRKLVLVSEDELQGFLNRLGSYKPIINELNFLKRN